MKLEWCKHCSDRRCVPVEKLPKKIKEYLKENKDFKVYTIDYAGIEDRVEGKYYTIKVNTKTLKLTAEMFLTFL